MSLHSGGLYVNVAAITAVMNVIILNESGDERIVTHHSRGDLHAASISGSAQAGHRLLLLFIPANINRPRKTQWLIYVSVGQTACSLMLQVFENKVLGEISESWGDYVSGQYYVMRRVVIYTARLVLLQR